MRHDEATVSEIRWRYREAAAVLSYFDPRSLRPRGPDEEPGGAVVNLRTDATPSHDPGLDAGLWILRNNVRRDTLARLANREAMRDALEANPARSRDPLQQAIEACISGSASPNADDLQSARAAVQAVDWLQRILDGLPDVATLRHRVDVLTLLEPFRQLAGSHFRGRVQELGVIADYVGVAVPDSAQARAIARMREVLTLHERPPLMIWGPGGIGKSSLVAQFLLTHARMDDPNRVAFAYVDFERPGFVDEPAEALQEAARQIAVQYPATRTLYEQMRSRVADGFVSRRDTVAAELLDDLALMVRTSTANTAPFLLLFNKFHELQHKSGAAEQSLGQLLEELQARLPRLRTILIGRVRAAHIPIQELEVSRFDHEAAADFLQAIGVEAGAATVVARRVGGNPLTLRLAATVLKSVGPEGLGDLDTNDLVFAGDALVQGQLYGRILAHIQDPDVRRLAHPSMVLRRITPAAIRDILAGPCELTLEHPHDAQRLFDELRREVVLFVAAEEGALRHRPDVRRAMLASIQRERPEQVKRIHKNAVAFYQPQAGALARAEEIYHRLSLDQEAGEIDVRWMPGVAPYLRSATEELHLRARRYLAQRLGIVLENSDSMAE
jgi:cellulose synthase operon protein C